jgi:hypothetical protein
MKYAYWRTDKPKEPGYSHELISNDLADFKSFTNEDELLTWPYEGVDTLYKSFYRLHKRIPKHNFFGSNIKGRYEWQTVEQVALEARQLAAGMMALNLCP